MKALVTGGQGFLGQKIVHELMKRAIMVRTFQRSPKSLKNDTVETFRGDLKDFDAVLQACEGCDVVFHVAAKAGVWGRYEDYYDTNVLGTKAVINACFKLGINKLIYTSSPSVVYDGRDQEGIDEDYPYPDYFYTHYQKTKKLAEELVLKANNSRLATISLRPHLIFGPGDNHLIPRIIEMARSGRLRYIGKANKKVDCTYIDNAAFAHMLAFDKLGIGSPTSGKAYFITNHEPWSIEKIIGSILDAHNISVNKKYLPYRVAYLAGIISEFLYKLLPIRGEPRITRFVAKQLSTAHYFDNQRACQELGYIPKVTLKEAFLKLKKSHNSSLAIS